MVTCARNTFWAVRPSSNYHWKARMPSKDSEEDWKIPNLQGFHCGGALGLGSPRCVAPQLNRIHKAALDVLAHCWTRKRGDAAHHRRVVVLAGPMGLGRTPRYQQDAGRVARSGAKAGEAEKTLVVSHGRSIHLHSLPGKAWLECATRVDGTIIDVLAIAPQTVVRWVDQAKWLWTDASAHWGAISRPLS